MECTDLWEVGLPRGRAPSNNPVVRRGQVAGGSCMMRARVRRPMLLTRESSVRHTSRKYDPRTPAARPASDASSSTTGAELFVDGGLGQV